MAKGPQIPGLRSLSELSKRKAGPADGLIAACRTGWFYLSEPRSPRCQERPAPASSRRSASSEASARCAGMPVVARFRR
jgi:hypothetical protein